jgi:hypothetical protein
MQRQHQVPRPWALWLFRAVVSLVALLGLVQAALAGGFLEGHFWALSLHALNATMLAGACGLLTVAAILLWRPGRGPGWPALVCLALIASVGAQIRLGYGRVLAVHVPLGVAIIVAIVLMLAWAFRRRPAAVPGAHTAPVRGRSDEAFADEVRS